MFGIASIGTAIKAGAAIVAALIVAGAIWYVLHLRSQVADLTLANGTLTQQAVDARAAAAVSAQSALDAVKASTDAQTIVADTHSAVAAATAVNNNILGDFNVSAPSDQTCTTGEALPAAYMRGLDGLFGQPAAAQPGGGGSNAKDQSAAGAGASLPAVAQPAKAP